MTNAHRHFNAPCPDRPPIRSRARVRLSLCVLIMGANLELMTSESSAATSPIASSTTTGAASDFFYHADDLYNVMAITDDTGAVADAGNERYEYADYGQPIDPITLAPIPGDPSAIGNPYLFTGRRYDPETTWYYYRTRHRDPITGRFTTRDTIGIWHDTHNFGNGYGFAGDNPVTKLDALGLETIAEQERDTRCREAYTAETFRCRQESPGGSVARANCTSRADENRTRCFQGKPPIIDPRRVFRGGQNVAMGAGAMTLRGGGRSIRGGVVVAGVSAAYLVWAYYVYNVADTSPRALPRVRPMPWGGPPTRLCWKDDCCGAKSMKLAGPRTATARLCWSIGGNSWGVPGACTVK